MTSTPHTPPPHLLPLINDRAVRPQRFERLLAGFVAAVACVAFTIAAIMNPYDEAGRPRTHGTHRQLGLPPCTMLSTVGFPCPSCGMTTSIALVFHGDVPAACRANWAGVLLAAGGVAVAMWLGLLAAGLSRPPRLSAECTILAFTVAGASAALIRYVGVLACSVMFGRS
jgi:hypothetical protein